MTTKLFFLSWIVSHLNVSPFSVTSGKSLHLGNSQISCSIWFCCNRTMKAKVCTIQTASDIFSVLHTHQKCVRHQRWTNSHQQKPHTVQVTESAFQMCQNEMHKHCGQLCVDTISHGVRQTITRYWRRSFALSALNAVHHHFVYCWIVYFPHGFLCIFLLKLCVQ